MEIKFHEEPCRFLRTVLRSIQQREESQELRLGDGAADIGRIIGCWGYPVVRSKEWSSGHISIGGAVMATVLYEPEDGTAPQVMQTWIPFQQKWDVEDGGRDGLILVEPKIRSIDARAASGRRMILRTTVSTRVCAMLPDQQMLRRPPLLPEDVQVKTVEYPMEIPVEYGEKQIRIEEQPEAPKLPVEQIIRSRMDCEVTEQRIMASRAVFRGNAKLHMCYLSGGSIQSYDTLIPFSQFAELDGECSSAAEARILPVLSDLEVTYQDGKLNVSAGVVAQMTVYDRLMVSLAEDAYSPFREVHCQKEELMLPVRLDCWDKPGRVCAGVTGQIGTVLDCNCLADHPRYVNGNVELNGYLQVLHADRDGKLQYVCGEYRDRLEVPADDGVLIGASAAPQGTAQLRPEGENSQLVQDMTVSVWADASRGQRMLSGLDMGEVTQADPSRPSLLLRRCGDDSLWEIAKCCGSTVTAIRKANALEGEPELDRMLLIPIL